MISRVTIISTCLIFAVAVTVCAQEGHSIDTDGGLVEALSRPSFQEALPFARPFALRSDALSKSNYNRLRRYALIGTNPRTGVAYDWRGLPKFTSLFECQLTPSQFSSPFYGKICNEQLLDAIRKNPELAKHYTARDIELLKNGRNPTGKQWHHDGRKKGGMQLVDGAEHSTDHVGGDKIWGRIDQKAFAKATAIRWGSVAVFDLAFSSAGLVYSDEFDLDHFSQAMTRSVAGGTAAFGTEYLMVRLFPQTIGMPPGWFAGLRILYGSPAAWAATLSYSATRALVDSCWETYRLRQLQIQEEACRIAEMKARWQRIGTKASTNTDALSKLTKLWQEQKGGLQ